MKAIVTWTPSEIRTLGADFNLFQNGQLGKRELRHRYQGRSFAAIKVKALRVNGTLGTGIRKVHYTPEQNATFLRDYSLFAQGQITISELRARYGNRTAGAFQAKAYSMGLREGSSVTTTPTVPLNALPNIPRDMKGLVIRLLAKGVSQKELPHILFGTPVKLKQPAIQALETLIGNRVQTTVRFVSQPSGDVSFVEVA